MKKLQVAGIIIGVLFGVIGLYFLSNSALEIVESGNTLDNTLPFISGALLIAIGLIIGAILYEKGK